MVITFSETKFISITRKLAQGNVELANLKEKIISISADSGKKRVMSKRGGGVVDSASLVSASLL